MTRDACLAEVARSAVFAGSVSPYLLLDRRLKIVSANRAYLRATGRAREELQGKHLFDAFPDNPADPVADGVANLGASLETVLRGGRRCPMWVQRYDIPGQQPDDPFVLKYWSPINSPVRDDPADRVIGIVHHVEDVTSLWAPIHGGGENAAGAPDLPATAEWVKFVAALATNEDVYEETRKRAEQLQTALTSRILVEQATGIMMAQRRCSPREAFEILRRFARSPNLNLRVVAQALVEQTHRPEIRRAVRKSDAA